MSNKIRQGTGTRPSQPVETASAPCAAEGADDIYMGYLDTDETISFLNVLLEAERAGAQATARMSQEAPDDNTRKLLRHIHADEVRYCRVLSDCIRLVGGEPGVKVGDFYEKLMKVEGFEERLAFLNRGQSWVARKLTETVSRIRHDAVHAALVEMRDRHIENIEAAGSVAKES